MILSELIFSQPKAKGEGEWVGHVFTFFYAAVYPLFDQSLNFPLMLTKLQAHDKHLKIHIFQCTSSSMTKYRAEFPFSLLIAWPSQTPRTSQKFSLAALCAAHENLN